MSSRSTCSKADEGTITGDLSQLFLELGSAAANKASGLVLLLDEVQLVSEVEYRAVVSALHRATQKNMPITLVAAGLTQIPRLTGGARSYTEQAGQIAPHALADLLARRPVADRERPQRGRAHREGRAVALVAALEKRT